jgi:dTDP-4-dehydrorhamnose 3,5-epimerase
VKVLATELPGVLLLEPRVFEDARGSFQELYHERRYAEAGIPGPFVQDNLSRSVRGTLRGLHFQEPHAQGKLIQVLSGSVYDVVVDVRRGSPTFGRWVGLTLSAESQRQLWVPPGFAHGFCVTSERCDFLYKCTEFQAPGSERGIAWDDPALAIPWPVAEPLLSPKDARLPRLAEAPVLPVYTG